jgi:glutathione S-transferase
MEKSTVAPAPPILEIRRTIRAPRQRVFDAWTKPEEMKKWQAPGPMTTPNVDVDLRVGGAYRVYMLAPDGATHVAFGTYREITPPSRLVYTWSWEGREIDSVVTVEFHDRGNATEVVLRHQLPNEDERGRHEHGWIGCFDKLEQLFPA